MNTQRLILIVDDDELFLGLLEKALQKEGFRTITASHGKQAQSIIGMEDLDAVVSDINMPGMSGIELAKFIHLTRPKLPMILMTGFGDLMETKEAYEAGVKTFIAKPFRREDLIEVLTKTLSPGVDALEEAEVLDEQYCKLPIDDFVSGKEIKYDIYVRLSDRKYLKVAAEGENLAADQIQRYKSKKILFLYLKRDDFRKYIGMNVALVPMVKNSKIEKERKINFMKHTSEVILEAIFLNGLDPESFEHAKSVVETSTSLLTDDKDSFSLLQMLNSHSDYLYAHSVGVSMYAVMLARKIGWTAPATIHKVAMGGMLHDIGMKEIDRGILDKVRKDMTAEEIKIYESHSFRGMEILNEVRSVPGDVIQIVLQHHENCLGMGFPVGLTRNRIHPMARLIAVADEFCSLALKSPGQEGLSPQVAIERMVVTQANKLEPAFLQALMVIFNMGHLAASVESRGTRGRWSA